MKKFPWKYTITSTSVTIHAQPLLEKYSRTTGSSTCIATDPSPHIAPDTPLYIDAITDQVLRIHTRTSPSFGVEEALVPTGQFRQEKGKIGKEDLSDSLLFSTSQLRLTLDENLQLQIYDRKGQLICADYTGKRPEADTLSPEETAQLIQEGHIVPNEDNPRKFCIYKQLFGNETIYGLGDKTGFLNKKGYDYMMWNSDNPDPQVENPTFKAMYKSIPFFIVLRPEGVYGIFLDNHFKTYFDMGYSSTDYYSFAAADGELDYYFIYGQTMPEVIQEYTSLTGRSPLPQLWTLGYHQSRWSYSSEQEVRDLAETFRAYDIPCDAIHLDIDYMEDFKVFTTSSQRFAHLKELSQSLQEQGIKLVAIIDPGTKAEDGYFLYDEGVDKGYFATTPEGEIYHNAVWPGDSVFPDYTNGAVRHWWGDQCTRLLEQGVRGIWTDMNEPASFQGPLPDDVVFPGDGDGTSRLHKEVHNVYGHLMAKATYEGLKRQDQRRPFVITRACYSGSQKYSTVWTGDNQSIWSHLKMSIPQLLNLGLSGIPIVGTDIGGFGSNTTPELLSRWIEASCFAPLFRNHCAKYSRRQEPWQFDQQTLDINRKYIRLHYKFLPYLYDLCYQESQTGLPILRPLVLHYEKDPFTWECNDEYLVGDSLLVAPVTDQGARARVVYLPEGIWVDYWTGERISGGKNILRDAPLDVCPLYVKAGSLLPTWPAMNSVPETGSSQLILEYYPSTEQNGCVPHYLHYQDNGTDFAYEQGEYNLYDFSVDEKGSLNYEMEHHGYAGEYQQIHLTVR